MPNPHVDEEKGKRAIVCKGKKGKKQRGEKKKKEELGTHKGQHKIISEDTFCAYTSV